MTDARGGPPPLLSARGLTETLAERTLFEGLDLDVRAARWIAIVGPNGSGKSTLLRLLLGLARPTRGRVSRAAGVHVGYVPQLDPGDRALPFPVDTVVAQGLPRRRARRLGLGRPRDAVVRALGRVGPSVPPGRRYAALSGGERRRVLLARALVGAPDLLVLDEPTAGLDSEGEDAVERLVQEEVEDRGTAVVWVAHGLPGVEASAHRVVRLGAGAS